MVAETLRGAREQLKGYPADEGLQRRAPSVRYLGLAAVFHGREPVACEAVESGADDGGDMAGRLVTQAETA